ncbi:MAG: ATPase family associated with various cellular activities (AAA) [Lentisphaerae bacterium ADurb.Bin242]|nr:MAG: ATPase family associated with various cellular activities (AAA) [Lentisphaerae bacterium ADurb.Bin242]
MRQEELQELQANITEVSAFTGRIKTEMSRILSGQKELIDRLLLAIIADGHVLLEGVPGLAKTLAVKTLAQTLDGSFSRLQFTPDLLPADLIGTNIYNPQEHSFSVKKGPVFANIVLADEINRAPAKVQSALLECMQEHQTTIAGTTYKMPLPFLVLATQNPIEQEGTYPLPEAQVDRFMFKVKVDYPNRAEERIIVERMAHPELRLEALAVASLADVSRAREWVDKIYMDEKILEYILDIVCATRPGRRSELSSRQDGVKLDTLDTLLQFGASPRAAISLALAAKGEAFLAGRAYVIPQDVKTLAPDVLRHRLILSYEAEAEGMTSEDIIRKILNELKTP